MKKVEVCILAGGKSRRMGEPKAKMLLEGTPLLDWARRAAHGSGLPYRIVDRDDGESLGPISGVRTALASTRADAVIFLPCDMPFVRSSTLRELATAGRAAFAVCDGLVGFPFLIPKRTQIRGESLQQLANNLGGVRVATSEEESFNINTPTDFAEAEKRVQQRCDSTVLEVDFLGIRRGTVEILSNVNWRVAKGEHWTILGANGSGKTSLLSALTGYLSATTGRIRLLGREFGRTDWRELRKHVGLVSSALRQLMADGETVLETVISGADGSIDRWGPIRKAEATRARAIMAEIGCSNLEKRVWAVLSQGERQRVLIGRALMGNPQALILDEPCAGLDPAAREHFLEFLEKLTQQEGGPAIILVTHHVEEITPGFTHVLALHRGRVAANGPKKEILTSKTLAQVFECQARLSSRKSRYSLQVTGAGKGVM